MSDASTLPVYNYSGRGAFRLDHFLKFYSCNTLPLVTRALEKLQKKKAWEIQSQVLTTRIYPSLGSPDAHSNEATLLLTQDIGQTIQEADFLLQGITSEKFKEEFNKGFNPWAKFKLGLILRYPQAIHTGAMPVSGICFTAVNLFVHLQLMQLNLSEKDSNKEDINNRILNLRSALESLHQKQSEGTGAPEKVATRELKYALAIMSDIAAQVQIIQDFRGLASEVDRVTSNLGDKPFGLYFIQQERIVKLFQQAADLQDRASPTSQSLVGEHFNPIHLVFLGTAKGVAKRLERTLSGADDANKTAFVVRGLQEYLGEVGLKTIAPSGEIALLYRRPDNLDDADFYVTVPARPGVAVDEISLGEISYLIKTLPKMTADMQMGQLNL